MERVLPQAVKRPALLSGGVLLTGVLVAVTTLLSWRGLENVGAEGESERGVLVARIQGRPVSGARLAAFLFDRQRESWLRSVDDLIDETIAAREGRRLGIGVPGEVVRRSVEREAAARETQLKKIYGDDLVLQDELMRAYGLGVADWKRQILEPRIRAQHLLMRIVRLDTRRRPRLRVRVIVLPSLERAQSVRKKLDAGADFSLMAVQESADATAKTGGVLPDVARGDLAWPRVERALFESPDGALQGPFEVAVEGRTAWHVYKVIEHVTPWTGNRGQLLALLEADLEKKPLARAEFERWRARVRRDFQVQVFSPDGRTVGGR